MGFNSITWVRCLVAILVVLQTAPVSAGEFLETVTVVAKRKKQKESLLEQFWASIDLLGSEDESLMAPADGGPSPEEDLNPICDEIRRLVDQAKSRSGSLAEQMVVMSGGARVVLLGERHDDEPVTKHYPAMMRNFQTKGFTCLALELGPDEDVNDFADWKAAADAARASGMTVHNIDISQTLASTFSAPWSQEAMQTRNIMMAQNIQNLIASGQCSKVVTLNGAAHLSVSTANGCVKSMPDLLEEKGISTHSVFMASTATQSGFVDPNYSCGALIRAANPYLISGADNAALLAKLAQSAGHLAPLVPSSCMNVGKASFAVF